MHRIKTILFTLLLLLNFGWAFSAYSQSTPGLWHGIERTVRYKPDGTDFIISNGTRRFNRAVYGTNTAFRIEAGDLPEFALYLPGMGGNLRLGLIKGKNSKWLINAQHIEARYRPGSMLYIIQDSLLGQGTLRLQLLAAAGSEHLILKADLTGVDADFKLMWVYGGATGKKFSRDGDIGADPESSFYLKPEYCENNVYQVSGNTFRLGFKGKSTTEATRYENEQSPAKQNQTIISKNTISGIFPNSSIIKQADAAQQSSPLTLLNSSAGSQPVVCGVITYFQQSLYWMIGPGRAENTYAQIAGLIQQAEGARVKLTLRVQLKTPDPYINTLGGALAIAADAIWETPSYLHGAVAWRMRLPAWRGAYAADVLGWHDRALQHFSSYAQSQILTPETGPIVADTALHLARQQEKLGNAMFSSGYISRNPGGDIRPHHYDMNLVFIDQLINHFYWTGDLNQIKKFWPTIKRHLDWEKRNFDRDGDGLYDAYCCIWASDALQYSGGGVTHSSAYNYRANLIAAQLARIAGDDPAPYAQEAQHIKNAVAQNLWIPNTGTYAEFKDLLGNRLLHTSPGLWTIYHAIDEGLPNAMQAYQSLRYIDTQIPHIPVVAKGLTGNYYLPATTNWLPYTWSLNNVAMAETMNTALAYWQGGRAADAFTLWKSALIESMYLGASPGNFQQLSFYDAQRGELYRDFADPIGVTARTVVEGLFGIKPDMLHQQLTIKPGFPAAWNYASLKTPDININFSRTGLIDSYTITSALPKPAALNLELNARSVNIDQVLVNGHPVNWNCITSAVGQPAIRIEAGRQPQYKITIKWSNEYPEAVRLSTNYVANQTYQQTFGKASVVAVNDPQAILQESKMVNNYINFKLKPNQREHTFFVQLKQGAMVWWQPVNFKSYMHPLAIQFAAQQEPNRLKFNIHNLAFNGTVSVQVNPEISTKFEQTVSLNGKPKDTPFNIDAKHLIAGSNHLRITYQKLTIDTTIINWNISASKPGNMRTVDIGAHFNDDIKHLFINQYLLPRPQSVTLQLPTQGIGNWCYPLTTANIDDSGLRKAAGMQNRFETSQHIVFATPGNTGKNIAFTSQWDNYPRSVQVQLSGSASHAYLLMAGSTNPMQSRLINAQITVTYADGDKEVLQLKNPENWCPIEQDYDDDGFAFNPGITKPLRVYLKTGITSVNSKEYTTIKGYTNKAIDGGAATVLDVVLNPDKKLKSLELNTVANDVVVGLMGITLVNGQ
ncbi:DUF4450 domain-containing protein [Mucilaginibacter sp. CSA2-8R]|uniref:DUF4450 domain-containing protein n=1 Tax=Mucilaginibacter sp. CSA2-8R TaxID=3141542 RepID=UPI00315D1356